MSRHVARMRSNMIDHHQTFWQAVRAVEWSVVTSGGDAA
jgi:hypothetical protein